MEVKTGELKACFNALIRQNLPEDAFGQLEKKLNEASETQAKMKFNLLFSSIPRLVGKSPMTITPEQQALLKACRKGFNPGSWTIDRFCRVYLLLHLDPSGGQQEYIARVEELFSAAEVYEQVALYSALPLYRFPEAFRFRTTDGIRTNITDVFDAIALDNPYPFDYLEEAAWNQMVLKALFMQRPIYRIYGIDQRANASLARILSDYAHERWSAGRQVSPELWRCFGPFMDEKLFADIRRLLAGNDPCREEAAVLACYDSDHPEAKELLSAHPGLAGKAERGELTWDTLGLACERGAFYK
ncbi:hypothetical protein EDD80_103246 [Anseongella ginsenosidimutans]|uniref:Uncharacterized protein n=1 Tax=Anseongella ginsenosidimutans TaxID=496056 RepID=A0A4V2UTZ4_9SPHI|nr:EboA domain-containing protein [Anseongella ginsenosidimutans]QEC53484.1 hypothetical protein FRZ59_14840 [Anseongella ginsenosidimutans]TCS88382.1 hypothetical protein EDD80_103246 [Anseongella ginsenosidimutans]